MSLNASDIATVAASAITDFNSRKITARAVIDQISAALIVSDYPFQHAADCACIKCPADPPCECAGCLNAFGVGVA